MAKSALLLFRMNNWLFQQRNNMRGMDFELSVAIPYFIMNETPFNHNTDNKNSKI